MRKFGARLRRTKRSFFRRAIFLAALVTIHWILSIPARFYGLFGASVLVGFCLWVIFKVARRRNRYINASGYVVLARENELEHRSIAKRLLGRNLTYSEVVHHINGNKTDNEVQNLCLMESEKHEHFHSWLRWKKEKTGRYPTIRDQKRVLVDEYRGTLLETHLRPRSVQRKEPQEVVALGRPKRLFAELRKERRRIADEKGIPAYMVFSDRTLLEMSEMMPDSESTMLKVHGVGSHKLRMYGPYFLSIVKKFKNNRNPDPGDKKDSA